MTNWKSTTLSELLNPIARSEKVDLSKEYKLLGVRLDGQGPFLRETKLGSQISAKILYKVQEGDFIYSRLFAWRGAFGIISKELAGCYVSGEFPIFNAKDEKLDVRYLFYWFRLPSTLESVLADCTGSTPLTRNRFKEEFFLNKEIPLSPIKEQQRVVARIEQLSGKVSEALILRKRTLERVEALNAVGRNIVFVSAMQKFDVESLGHLSRRITKGESPAWQGFGYQDSGPIFVRSENVLWGKLDTLNAVHISDGFYQKLSRSQLYPNDVLINLVGASIGRACVVPENLGLANVNQAVGVISPYKNKILSDYLVHFLLSTIAQDEIHGGKVDTARPNISLGDVRNLKIPLPTISEQQQIVTQLDVLQAKVDAIKKLQFETSVELDALLPSILDRAFKGELV